MEISRRLALLEKLFRLHHDFISSRLAFACRKGCALCCTANVTMTTLEGLYMLNYWEHGGLNIPLADLTAAARTPRFQPAITLNRLAAMCLQGRDVPEDAADPNVGPCPLLRDGICSIYAARPFGCRAMVSRIACGQHGAADMPEVILHANNVVLQYIEAVDTPGAAGNLTDVLLNLSEPTFREAYQRRRVEPELKALLPNQAIPALMVPPEYRQALQPLLQAIRKLFEEIG